MNPTQQKNHRTVTASLASTLTTVAEASEERFADVDRRINDERTHRLKLADEQRAYVDARDRELRTCCQERWDEQCGTNRRAIDALSALRDRGFWSRLNWLLTGR